MIQATARLLRLLTLLQSRSTWTGAELAERLEITTRSLRRDVDRLRRLGYPIEAATGVAGGYQLGAGASLPPLSLDQDEATAVFVGLHAVTGTGITEAGTAAMRALAKLERVLPSRLRKNLRMLQSSVVGLSVRSRPLSLAKLSTLAGACNERLVTRITYTSRDGTTTDRRVEPLRLVHIGALFYLLAWDLAKEDWRIFRLDRMAVVEAKNERFNARPPPDADLVAYVTRSISASPFPHRAKVLLHAGIEEVRPRVGAFDALFEPASAGKCTMELGAPTLDVLVARIVWLGIDFEVLAASPELRRHLTIVANRLRASVRSGHSKSGGE
ncbi:Transcriptional regulator, DeoR family [Labilithrix luteola]|uniref:Transcriptional regulator, DeoR family n=1 Tax=Labilithrix luteola TaxID=1391654 RepID=A0A0K1PJE2_9BACT|nr:WYL domain-containing protein [Labilithrix luteola]AKU93642.1 Transcriptional regulator, DeoR family [Labilithrix luteola]